MANQGLGGLFRNLGVHRIVGHAIPFFLYRFAPYLQGMPVIFAHIVTVSLFFRLCQLLLESSAIAFLLSLVMAVFPWGHQALVWLVENTFVLATAFFFGNLLVLISFSSAHQKQGFAFCASYLLSLLSLLSNECLLFSLVVSGSIAWFPKGKFSVEEFKRRAKERYSGWAPLLGVFSYLVCYDLAFRFLTVRPPTKIPHWNPESILSVPFYQYSHIYVFQGWLSPIARRFIFFEWNGLMFLVSVCLAALFIVCLHQFAAMASYREVPSAKPNKTLLFYLIALIVGACFIYAVGGGYSLDTRKKYSLIPLLLLLIGYILRTFLSLRISISTKTVPILFVLSMVGVGTTWLNTGVWRYEVMRYDSLVEFLVGNHIAGDIRVERHPDLYEEWPTLTKMWGIRMVDDNFVLNEAILGKGGRPVHVTRGGRGVTVEFDERSSRWRSESS